eukprot:CAMPEP_0119128836 /NCGR_PEP_ID=MMETSP1310-20130426/6829_1 /TAXON_ID=464262 /ORGANISM="Genus nov. species nov., Strain RCC2339" /LENGTH=55 /DNA_ID=CAMNT_0007119209 /DNA_START=143 /DNA_END=306 /DNA_ORIENTATION=+
MTFQRGRGAQQQNYTAGHSILEEAPSLFGIFELDGGGQGNASGGQEGAFHGTWGA